MIERKLTVTLVETRATNVVMTLDISATDQNRIDELERELQRASQMLQRVLTAFENERLAEFPR